MQGPSVYPSSLRNFLHTPVTPFRYVQTIFSPPYLLRQKKRKGCRFALTPQCEAYIGEWRSKVSHILTLGIRET